MSDDPFFSERLELAKAGDREARYAVAQAYLFGTGVEESVEKAMSWLGKAAEDGHRAAQVQLADHLRFNDDGKEDQAKAAVAWYRRAADQNDSYAQYQLGQMYLNGTGVPADKLMAVNLFRAAAASNNADAIRVLATMGDAGQLSEASAAWMQEAAEGGDAQAQYNRGEACWQGTDTAQDRAEAVKWYERAAAQGHGLARYRLAQLLWAGEEIGRDRSRAVTLYRQAASQGIGEAQATLVHLYLCGVQVGGDAEEALRWMRARLWSLDDASGQRLLGEMYLYANSVPGDAVRAAAWLQRAAENGVGRAQMQLGRMYLTGRGVPLDPAQGEHWLKLAAAQGDREALVALGRLYLSGAIGIAADMSASERCFEMALGDGGFDEPDVALAVASAYLDFGIEQGVATSEKLVRNLLRRAVDRDLPGSPVSPAFDRLHFHRPSRTRGQTRRCLGDLAYKLGQCYRTGHGVDLDVVQAMKWLDVARDQDQDLADTVAEQLNDIQSYLLGDSSKAIIGAACGVAQAYRDDRDLPAATRNSRTTFWLRSAAEWGDAQAQLDLSRLLTGTEEGLTWLRRSAEAGLEEAQLEVAIVLDEGRGAAVDADEAVKWLRLAVAQGHGDAQYRLANRLRAANRTTEATDLYRQAAEHGHDLAQVALANVYLVGDGVPVSNDEAARWLRKSQRGWRENVSRHFDPMLALALACMTGDGTERDIVFATEVLHEAVNRAGSEDNLIALGSVFYALGQRYRDGVGVESSPVQAIKWFDCASHFGSRFADRSRYQMDKLLNAAGPAKPDLQRQVGEAFLGSAGCERFQSLADFWAKSALAEEGTAEDWLAFSLALFTLERTGEAIAWLRQAAEAGHGPAQAELAESYLRGRGVPLDPVEAARWQSRAEQAMAPG